MIVQSFSAPVRGGGRMLRGYSYYDTALLEEIFRTHFGSMSMIDTAKEADVPKVPVNIKRLI